MPIATPASAAPRTGAAPSPHEKALRLPPPRLLEDVRFDERLWVRVGMDSSLAGIARFNGWRRRGVPACSSLRGASATKQSSPANLDCFATLAMTITTRSKAPAIAGPAAALRPGS